MQPKKKSPLRPQMPDKWDEASLENVKVGNNEISLFYSKIDDEVKVRVTQNNPDWTIKIKNGGEEVVKK